MIFSDRTLTKLVIVAIILATANMSFSLYTYFFLRNRRGRPGPKGERGPRGPPGGGGIVKKKKASNYP
jgi:hypothetical protein